jgi:hypothetical protein
MPQAAIVARINQDSPRRLQAYRTMPTVLSAFRFSLLCSCWTIHCEEPLILLCFVGSGNEKPTPSSTPSELCQTDRCAHHLPHKKT